MIALARPESKENPSVMDLYMSGVSNRMNGVMKVLTVVSTLSILRTCIAGSYGVNFVHMPQVRFA